MNEITLNVDGKIYRVTNQNNNNKFGRAQEAAGTNASPRKILAHYHKLGGYIQDENGNKIENVSFWQEERGRIEANERFNKKLKLANQITSHPVVSSFIVIAILAILGFFLKIDLSRFY
ncbi:MAG: hypothetical protein AAB900_01380 [Patescibacteria group bacterium]